MRDKEKPCSIRQRWALVRLTGNYDYLDKSMYSWEAGTYIRRLKSGGYCKAELVGRKGRIASAMH